MTRLLLLVAVVALGVDAILYSGAYSQSAWRTLSVQVEKLTNQGAQAVSDLNRPKN